MNKQEKTYTLPANFELEEHPGVILQDEINARDISQRALAKRLSVKSSVINDLIKGRRNFTVKLALDLEVALGIEASSWMNLQISYDLFKERKLRGMVA